VRAEHLNNHAGQISFPGGRIDPEDTSSGQAALRELKEEVGIDAQFVDMVGRIETYETSTGFQVYPFLGVLKPGFVVERDPNEVAEIFEVPFEFLMNSVNHQHHSREWEGRMRYFYAMPWQDKYIWGATAGMLRSLHDKLYS
jgi:8-oxo-dGTP pyrophosphatase MutT (NUDIX family)